MPRPMTSYNPPKPPESLGGTTKRRNKAATALYKHGQRQTVVFNRRLDAKAGELRRLESQMRALGLPISLAHR